MFSLCPKCESGKLDSTGSCKACNYTLRVLCKNCSTANIPTAKFCGGCGRGMSLSSRVSKLVNSRIDHLLQLRLRKFVAGASFGALLGLFTLSSIGMRPSTNISAPIAISNQTAGQYTPICMFTQQMKHELHKSLSIYEKDQLAELSHLIKTTNIILKHLSPIATAINGKKSMAASARKYLNLLNNFSKSDKLTRGSAAIIAFNLLSDFMNFTYRDFQDNGQFSDIPKHHFLSIPATALSQFGILTEYPNQEFCPAKTMTVMELNEMTEAIMSVAEIHVKEKVFNTLPPVI